ncbi:immunoglobulin lambda-1 light chain-like [Hemitrygon akajei]|uniref:immunoglobulin lambda-1 light chain-like n=1 Tax=Hemitrygon akajei TaxID=2704970 RepID=UPI003BF963FA
MAASASTGQTVRIECRMQNGDVRGHYIRWYRQRFGERPELVLVHATSDDIYRGTGITDRFQPSRGTSSNSHILTMSGLGTQDSAVYYCAVWDNGFIFGPGTILGLKSSESRMPSVVLLPPSPEETSSALRWSEDGVETESGVTTGTVSLDTDQTYRLSSYLRVPVAAWNRGSSYSCSVSHSSLSSPLRNTISSSACAQ